MNILLSILCLVSCLLQLYNLIYFNYILSFKYNIPHTLLFHSNLFSHHVSRFFFKVRNSRNNNHFEDIPF